ncbi:hypothetical protein [Vibrio vulnificus YJ016]|uniref:Uncharacterized protein n=1 Tax=Vibrio vulnificus (strain YJ016) TaxID=196600 RepID=Q7MED6_VIBVY|nr:hypothetical protein [Vibrio vulnificus YJ016]
MSEIIYQVLQTGYLWRWNNLFEKIEGTFHYLFVIDPSPLLAPCLKSIQLLKQ